MHVDCSFEAVNPELSHAEQNYGKTFIETLKENIEYCNNKGMKS